MRNLLQAVLDELPKDQIRFAVLGEFQFLSGTQNLWAGPEGQVLQWDSKNWTALGEIGQLDKVAEAQGLTDARTIVSLRVNSENVSVVDVEDSRGRIATITLLLLDADGQPIGPINFRMTMGKVDIASAVQEDENGRRVVNEALTLELLSETASLRQKHFVRMTYEAGLRIDATDHGLEFIADPDMGFLGHGVRALPGEPGGRPLLPGENIR